MCLWWREGTRGKIIVGSFSSFMQPVADVQVQRLLRQNENDSLKTRMGCFPRFFLLYIWKGLLWTSSSPLKECSCSATVHTTKNGFVSHPLSSEPKAQWWAGISLSLKCSLLPEATEWKKSQEELLGTFSSEVAPAGSAAFSPHTLCFLTEAFCVKNRLKIMSNASRLHNEMLATRCSSHVTHFPAFLSPASFCSGWCWLYTVVYFTRFWIHEYKAISLRKEGLH